MPAAKQILLCITQFFCVICFAQTSTIDSLKRILPLLNGTARIDCYNELASEFSDRYWSKSAYQQTDTALMFASLAMRESEKLNYQKGIGRAYQNLGYIKEEHGNLVAAEDYTRKALVIFEKENVKAQYHRAHVFLGWILSNRGFYNKAAKIYEEELPYYEAIKDSASFARLSRMTAGSYNAMGFSGKAFNYLQKDFAIQKTPSDAWGKRSSSALKASVYLAADDTANAVFYYTQAALSSKDKYATLGAYQTYMAIAYGLQKKYDSALLQIRKRIEIIQSSNKDSLYRKVALMISYIELSNAFFATKNFDSSIVYGKQPLIFFKDSDCVTYLMPLLKTLATIYNTKKENTAALFYTNSLITYAKRSNARPLIRDAYKLLWEIYTDQHNTNLAKDYQLKYILLNDSLQNDKYISQAAAWKAINDININEANYKNQLSVNEARIRYINEEKRTQLYVFIAAIVLISLFAILIIRNSRLKRKKDQLQLMMTEANIALEKQKREQEVAQLNQQKTELELQALRAQMNPHFIFNCLNSINRFIINNDAVKAADYLTKFAKLIRIVLEQSGKSFVPLEDELKCLQLYMDLEALRFEIPFQYEINCNGTDTSSLMIPTLLMQPFVENAIWHGLQGNTSNGKINIDMHLKDDILYCSICDNGIGRTVTVAKDKISLEKKSMGINITQNRLQLIDVSKHKDVGIEIHDLVNDEGYNSGTCVNIRIPVKEI